MSYLATSTHRLLSLLAASLTLASLSAQEYRLATVARRQPLATGNPATQTFIGLPFYLAARNGELYFVTGGNFQIHKADARGIISLVAGNGTQGFSGDGGSGLSANLTNPADMAFDSRGNLYFLDGPRLRRITTTGMIETVAGNGGSCPASLPSPARTANFCALTGLTVNSRDEVFISEGSSGRIIRIDAQGNASTFASGLSLPLNLQFSPSGDLYFRDSSAVKVRRADGSLQIVPGTASLTARYIALDPTGALFVIADDAVVSVNSGAIQPVVGVRGFRQNGNDGPTGSRLDYPVSLISDSPGSLFIADTLNCRIVRRAASGVISTVVGSMALPNLSTSPFFPVGRLGSGIVADRAGITFLDLIAREVRQIDPTGRVRTLAGNGTSIIGANGAPALQGGLGANFAGFTRDAQGTLLLASFSSNNLLQVSPDAGFRSLATDNGTFSGSPWGNYAIATDGNSVYYVTASATSGIGTIRRWSASGSEVLATGRDIRAIAASPNGELYAIMSPTTDTAIRNSVYRVTRNQLDLVAGSRTSTAPIRDGVPAAQNLLPGGSVALAIDRSGAVYVAASGDSSVPGTVVRIGNDGILRVIAGVGTGVADGSVSDGSPAKGARIPSVNALSVDEAGRVFLLHYTGVVALVPETGAGACTLRATPGSVEVPAGGGNVSLDLTASQFYCPWTLPADLPSWLRATSDQRQGSGHLTLAVSANPGPARQFSLSLGGTAVQILQAAAQVTAPLPQLRNAQPVLPSFGGNPSRFTSNMYLELYGTNLSTTTRTWTGSDFNGASAPTSLDGVSVLVNGKPAYIYFISPTQINLNTPDDTATGPVEIQVKNSNGHSNAITATRARVAPTLQTIPQFLLGGVKYVVAQTTDFASFIGQPDSLPGVAFVAAKPGDTVILFALGCGPTTPATQAGVVAAQNATLALPYTVTIGGVKADVTFAGLNAGTIGLYQLNVVIPEVPAGNQPIELTIDGLPNAQNLSIAVGK